MGLLLVSSALKAQTATGSTDSTGPTEAAVFEKVFKKKPNTTWNPLRIPVHYELEREAVGYVNVRVQDLGNNVLVEREGILPIINQLLLEGKYADLPSKEWLALKDLLTKAYQVEFDNARLILVLKISPNYRRPSRLSVRNFSTGPGAVDYLNPSWFSAYLNINSSQDFRAGIAEGDSIDRLPFKAQFDQVINFGGQVFEANAKYYERQDDESLMPAFSRGDVRLTSDYPSVLVRQTLGDLNYRIRGFQVYKPMGGISWFRNFSLRPSQLSVSTGAYQLFLKRASKVNIFINEQLVQIMNLPAGTHDLRNFPFANGLNDVRIEITDDLGQTETVLFSFFSNGEILEMGTSEFSYAIGAPSKDELGKRSYDPSLSMFSLFHRFGKTARHTAGYNLQINKTQIVVGGESVMGLPIGFLKLEPVFSGQREVFGFALRSRYFFTDTKGYQKSQRTYGVGYEGYLLDFRQFGSARASPISQSFTGFMGQGIGNKLSANFALTYNINRKITEEIVNGFRVNVGASKRWKNGLGTNVSLQYLKDSLGRPDASLFFHMTWNFSKERQFVTASHSTASDTMNLDWNFVPSAGSDRVNARVGINRSETTRGFNADVIKLGNRARYGFLHASQFNSVYGGSSHLTSFQLGTALAFAGWGFSISRPIADSFAIVKPTKSLRGQKLELNPTSEGEYSASTDWMGSAVMPDLTPYNYNNLKIGTHNLRVGTPIDRDVFTLYPTYKSGFRIELGSDANIRAQMKLRDFSDNPVSLQAGWISSVSDPEFAKITVFTNANGDMIVDGLKPGQYVLEFRSNNYDKHKFKIGSDVETEIDLGVVKVAKKGN